MRAVRALALAALATAVAVQSAAAVRYSSVTKTMNEKGNAVQQMVVDAWVDGANGRVEFRQAKGAPVPDRGYLVTTDGGRTLYMVDPEEKIYMKWDLEGMMQTLGALGQSTGGMVSMEFSDVEVEDLGSEPGGEILGYDTRVYRSKSAYTMRMKVFGMKREMRVVSENRAWVTPELDAAGFSAWLRASPPKTGDDELDGMIEAYAKAIPGTPLKTESVSTTTDGKGEASTSRSVMEVTEIEKDAEVAEGFFALPAGYTETEMPSLGGGEGGEDGPSGLGDLLKSMGG